MTELTNLTEEELYKLIHYIRTRFKDHLHIKHPKDFTDNILFKGKQEWKDKRLTFETMTDSEILISILNEDLAWSILESTASSRHVYLKEVAEAFCAHQCQSNVKTTILKY